MAFKLKKRCKFCAHVLRDDGTCQNPNCANYTDEKASADATTSDNKETETSGD